MIQTTIHHRAVTQPSLSPLALAHLHLKTSTHSFLFLLTFCLPFLISWLSLFISITLPMPLSHVPQCLSSSVIRLGFSAKGQFPALVNRTETVMLLGFTSKHTLNPANSFYVYNCIWVLRWSGRLDVFCNFKMTKF